jgi:hypothetical protein
LNSQSQNTYSSQILTNDIVVEDSIIEDWESEENINENCCNILSENFDEELEQKIEQNKQELEEKIQIFSDWWIDAEKFIIKIPESAVKEDFYDLKDFISTLETWNIKIFLNLRWQEINTKISLSKLDELNEWIKKKW